MPLNILHHKSWNVYNTENIERVRKDEAKAKEEEQKKKERAIQAEREFRLSLLRQKNSINTESNSEKISLDSSLNENGHINLFYEEEQQINSGKNKEREEEEKKEKEKFESQFIYSLTGKDKEKPWYSLEKSNINNNNDINNNNKAYNNDRLKQLNKDKKRKEVEDPLEVIKKNLEKNKEIEMKFKESLPYYQRNNKDNKNLNNIISNSETFINPTKLIEEFSKKRKYNSDSDSSYESSSESDTSSNSDSHKRKKHSKHHHHHHHRHKHSHSHKNVKSSKKHSKKKKKHHEKSQQENKSSIEKLREERLKREQEERQRALNVNGVQKPTINLVEEDKYYYNSQFNPDSIRQLKKQ